MLQHNRQWTRWIPIILWIAGIIWVITAQGEAYVNGMSMALITAPVGLGIPMVGVFVCHQPRSRRVYAGSAIAGGASIAAMMLVIAVAAVLSAIREDFGDMLRVFGDMMGMIAPLMMGALAMAIFMLVWVLTFPKPEEEAK